MTTTLMFLFLAFLGVVLLLWAVPVRLWIEAVSSRVRLGLGTLIGMRLRKVSPPAVVRPLIASTKAGLPLDVAHLEAHYLAGGDVHRVVRALISADKATIELPFQRAAAIDLAGRDVLEAVQMSVNPKVVQTPRVAAMAKDGIQLIAVARVTVRANINRLVGGAGEETILARVGEGIVSTIGSADTHKGVLENPDAISKTVLQKGLDSGTAFEILSIDIADVDVGKNIGAELQTDQAEADKRIAQAQAEKRRAMATAREQEMKARVEEMRAEVIAAEAQIPLAMADAFRSGNMGIMDYARYRNIESDTQMRRSIAEGEPDESVPPS
ncbi:MAG: flotillin-like protein FloA [Gemmatimonadetes bacterium]|nr:flotillin-like protein FloA [Gemmatimonadota bacterium]